MKKEYSNEEIISLIQEKSKELGKTPTRRDLKNIGDLASYRFGTWNNALKMAKLEQNEKKNYTREELIKIIQKKAAKLGRTPFASEIRQIKVILKKFPSFSHALKEAGLKEEMPFNLDKTLNLKKQLIKVLQDKEKELGRTPKKQDLESISIFITVFGTFTEALRQAKLTPNTYRNENELIAKLRKVASKTNNAVSMKTVRKYEIYAETYVNRFGSWNNALKLAGLKENHQFNPSISLTDEELIDKYIEICNSLNKIATVYDLKENGIGNKVYARRFGSITKLRYEIICNPKLVIEDKTFFEKKLKYTDNELKAILKMAYRDNNNEKLSFRKLSDYLENNGLPNISTFFTRFKTYKITRLWEIIKE